jgi:hypothetical protein
LLGRLGKLAGDNRCIFLLETEKKLLPENRKFKLATFRQLGIIPGVSLYFQGVIVRQPRPVGGFDIACKLKLNYQEIKLKDAWFIRTDLESLLVAIAAYKKRRGIE